MNQLMYAENLLADRIKVIRELSLSEQSEAAAIAVQVRGYEEGTGKPVQMDRIWAYIHGLPIPPINCGVTEGAVIR